MPYRIDLLDPPADALEQLVELGAIDVEHVSGGLAALMPDSVEPASVASTFRASQLVVSPAQGRDDGSVWVLSRRPFNAAGVQIVPAHMPVMAGALRLVDGAAFGSGLHPTTALCLDMIDELLNVEMPAAMLDVGTGSGILALVALARGVPRAVGVDIDSDALGVASENARINDLTPRLRLIRGGPEALRSSWPIVIANVLAAPLMEMAPALTRVVAHGGRLILSGIPSSMSVDVEQVYRRFGMREIGSEVRAGWSALTFTPSW